MRSRSIFCDKKMDGSNTEAWQKRKENDQVYHSEIISVLKLLKSQAKSQIEYYKHNKSNNSEKFLLGFRTLLQHLQFQNGIDAGVSRLFSVAHKYDFDPSLPANGYRSFTKIFHKCCMHLVQLCRHIATNRSSLLFRTGHHSRELIAYVTTLGQLRACIYYLDKMIGYCAEGKLFPDESVLTEKQNAECDALLKEVETLDQDCFYGRCLGFQVWRCRLSQQLDV